MRLQHWLISVVSAAAVFIPFGVNSQSTVSVHLTLGNPSGATTSTSNPNNYLLLKPQYVIGYNNSRRISKWVSWQLNQTWLGTAPRQDNFRADPALPSSFVSVTTSDYTGSGFDRGHMAPSADRTRTTTDNSSTFLMTNIIPQAPDNNQGPWARLEDYSRTLVTTNNNELYIISGSYGTGGTGSNGTFNAISTKAIAVPNRVWKVIVVCPQRGLGVSCVQTNTRVIAVDMPNTQGIRNVNWGTYRVSVDSIEARTGLNLLSLVNSTIQSVVESRVDAGPTS